MSNQAPAIAGSGSFVSWCDKNGYTISQKTDTTVEKIGKCDTGDLLIYTVLGKKVGTGVLKWSELLEKQRTDVIDKCGAEEACKSDNLKNFGLCIFDTNEFFNNDEMK
ncbi:MAG: hypothetical protein F6K54_20200 [Okeania sp. SIO3B5]|uniref:hypothetical protein n=1 Tax=Okeania sp. SIO3B5 TaxID=2607811 RepID=UPI0013FF4EAE|nr:hypothetical protein [Okeania sp. SIO3B5]NEO55194.1 hypothetical protein [Okeania sp. SIO3B5]